DAAMVGNEVRMMYVGARLFGTAAPFTERTALTTWYLDYDSTPLRWWPLDQTQGNTSLYWSLAPRILALDDGSWRVTWKEYPFNTSSTQDRFHSPTLYITSDLTDLLG